MPNFVDSIFYNIF